MRSACALWFATACLLWPGAASAASWRGGSAHFQAQAEHRQGVLQVQLHDAGGQPLRARVEARTPTRAWPLQSTLPGRYQAAIAADELQHLRLIVSTPAWRDQVVLQELPEETRRIRPLLIALVLVLGTMLSPLMALRAIRHFRAPVPPKTVPPKTGAP